MRWKGYDSRSVYVSVCYQANLPHTLFTHWRQGTDRLFMPFQHNNMHCVDVIENALFKSSGNNCWPHLPSLLLDELSIDERDSDRLISSLVVCRSSNSSCNLTDSSLLTVDCELCFLALLSLCVLDLLIWHACNRDYSSSSVAAAYLHVG
jgi:hypothetical protein